MFGIVFLRLDRRIQINTWTPASRAGETKRDVIVHVCHIHNKESFYL